jgi:hypothetical protein
VTERQEFERADVDRQNVERADVTDVERRDEGPLRDAFAALARDTRRRAAVPDFDAMLARARAEASAPARGPRPPSAVAWARPERWLALAAAAAVATLLLVDGSSRADREFERVVGSWTDVVNAGALRSPTEGLLRTPGLDLGSVPTFGSWPGSSLPGLDLRPAAADTRDPRRDS